MKNIIFSLLTLLVSSCLCTLSAQNSITTTGFVTDEILNAKEAVAGVLWAAEIMEK